MKYTITIDEEQHMLIQEALVQHQNRYPRDNDLRDLLDMIRMLPTVDDTEIHDFTL